MSAGPAPGRRIGELLEARSAEVAPPAALDLPVTGIAADSREVRPGHLFVALPGTRVDAHAFLRDAVDRGAAAVVVERPVEEELGVPVIRVPSSRETLAQLAAAWHGRPAERLRLVGITGTIGKTSVLKMLEAILRADGRDIGTIGTMGVSLGGETDPTGYTAPSPLLLQRSLARIAGAGCELAAMEVTSHALDQARVHGLAYDLGVFTNLVPLEHSDYHGSFRGYVRVKRRFLGYLRPEAPLVFSEDDQIVRRVVREHRGPLVGCGREEGALVRSEEVRVTKEGTSLVLNVRSPIPRLDGGEVAPMRLPLCLRLLGRPTVTNASLAVAAALSLRAAPESIREALAVFPPLKRRMEMIDLGSFWVMDDAASHPDSVSALFEVVEQLPVRRVFAVFAIRGQRGAKINRRTAEALAIWATRRPLDRLILTRSVDAVDELNRVEEPEREAFRSSLRRAAVPFEEIDALGDAIPAALDSAGAGDLVLLLGTQGMDEGGAYLEEWLRTREAGGAVPGPGS
jgi:UDP-N-acetylmuramoyl-L-alanyl-D-glutamate--2,6-diaminopimelate ligase